MASALFERERTGLGNEEATGLDEQPAFEVGERLLNGFDPIGTHHHGAGRDLAGLKVEQGWNSETRVTEADFRARLNAWLGQTQGR